jgi:hypothetical protein
MKRRDFIKNTAMGAAVVAIPMTVAAGVIHPAERTASGLSMLVDAENQQRKAAERINRMMNPPDAKTWGDVPLSVNDYAGTDSIVVECSKWVAKL